MLRRMGKTSNAVPLDLDLYEEVKAEMRRKYVWPSAYGSAALVREYKRRGGRYSPRRNGAPGGDYMALPSMMQIQDNASDVIEWLKEARDSERPLEDWVESKISRMSSDMEDIHTFAVYGERARQEARANPPLSWHLRHDDVYEILEGLLDRTGRVEDILAILADIYQTRRKHSKYKEVENAMQQTSDILHNASDLISDIWELE